MIEKSSHVIHILEMNIHRNATPHDLIGQILQETKKGLLLPGEHDWDRNSASWYADISDIAVIWVRGAINLRVQGHNCRDGFV